jgi:hypothetical protein
MLLGKHGGVLGSKKDYEPGNSGAMLFAQPQPPVAGTASSPRPLDLPKLSGDEAVPTPSPAVGKAQKNAQANLRVLRQAETGKRRP